MPSYKQLLSPQYIEYSYISACKLDDKQIRIVFTSYPWCLYIGLPGQKAISRLEFFAVEVTRILELKRQRIHILTAAAVVKLVSK